MQATFKEAYVRRSLWLLARNRMRHHSKWFRYTSLGFIPILPLLVSPLPNLPLYYLGYRCYSHKRATTGALATVDMLRNHSNAVRAGLQEAIKELQRQGHKPSPGSWASTLADVHLQPAAPAICESDATLKLTVRFECSDKLGELTKVGIKCGPSPPFLPELLLDRILLFAVA
jgi:hypothetical protein